MGGLNNKQNIKGNKNNNSFENDFNLEYSNNNHDFGDIIFIPLIMEQIFQFIDEYNKKNVYLCNKKFYQLYCNKIKKLKIFENVNKSRVKKTFNKYKNLEYLEIYDCNDISFLDENCNIKKLKLSGSKHNLKIKNFTPLFKLDKLEILYIIFADISNISFLKNIKNLKELHLKLFSKKIIEDSSPIS